MTLPSQKSYKYIVFPIMFYMAIELTAALLVGRQVAIGHDIVTTASVPILPLSFFCSDIISEVYGYQIARQVIWVGMLCELFFAIFCYELIKLPAPALWHGSLAYKQVLGDLPRIFVAGSAGRIAGLFLNVYIISRLKVIVRGRYFWLRSLGSTSIGELIFTVTSVVIIFAGVVPMSRLLSIIITAYLYKIVFSPVAVIPAIFCVKFLKKHENVDAYDVGISFNPFKLALDE